MSSSENFHYDIREILAPSKTPEMGFESIAMLTGDKAVREKNQSDFFIGNIRNPKLDYPRLNEPKLDDGIRNLQHILTIAEELDSDNRLTVWDSASYRMAEMYWLKSLLYLQSVIQSGNETRLAAAAKQHQMLNEELFGKPDLGQYQQIIGEVMGQIKTKQLSPNNQKALDELLNGFVVQVANEQIQIPAVLDYNHNERLPVIATESLNKLTNLIKQQFDYFFEAIDGYYHTTISQRPENSRAFTPMDLFVIFNLLRSRDGYRFKVVLDDDATAMMWDIGQQVMVVGGRHPNIKSRTLATAKIFHEYGVHAERSINGLSSNLPVMGTGLFLNPDNGDNVDYLTFEEGFASICEFAIQEDKIQWDMKDLEKTIAVNLAYRGFDFRQTFEALIRIRQLMISRQGEDLKPESLNRVKRNSYLSVERIFRGTPTDLPRIDRAGHLMVLTNNKDLAYLNGKLKAFKFAESAEERMLKLVFEGKFDPTASKQLDLAKKYLLSMIR